MSTYGPAPNDYDKASGFTFKVEVDHKTVVMEQENQSDNHSKVIFNKSKDVSSLLILWCLQFTYQMISEETIDIKLDVTCDAKEIKGIVEQDFIKTEDPRTRTSSFRWNANLPLHTCASGTWARGIYGPVKTVRITLKANGKNLELHFNRICMLFILRHVIVLSGLDAVATLKRIDALPFDVCALINETQVFWRPISTTTTPAPSETRDGAHFLWNSYGAFPYGDF